MRAKRKRHTEAEIATKLGQAAELAARGQTQSEIARSLGVSVMTVHRWRKSSPGGPRPVVVTVPDSAVSLANVSGPHRQAGLASLQQENVRLRTLVTDLLLEKMRLEEVIRRLPSNGSSKSARR